MKISLSLTHKKSDNSLLSFIGEYEIKVFPESNDEYLTLLVAKQFDGIKKLLKSINMEINIKDE